MKAMQNKWVSSLGIYQWNWARCELDTLKVECNINWLALITFWIISSHKQSSFSIAEELNFQSYLESCFCFQVYFARIILCSDIAYLTVKSHTVLSNMIGEISRSSLINFACWLHMIMKPECIITHYSKRFLQSTHNNISTLFKSRIGVSGLVIWVENMIARVLGGFNRRPTPF